MNEHIMKVAGFNEEVKLVKAGKCPFCKTQVTGFRDLLSLKEYNISGLCQSCQDDFFGA